MTEYIFLTLWAIWTAHLLYERYQIRRTRWLAPFVYVGNLDDIRNELVKMGAYEEEDKVIKITIYTLKQKEPKK